MSGWSFGIGKIFGVEIRVHSFFLFLVLPASIWASVEGRSALRGFLLWTLLLAAVLVREVARSLAAAAYSLDVKSILLLPTGGLLTYANPEAEARAGESKVRRGMALVGPITNLLFGLVVMGLVLTISPSVDIFGAAWVSPAHLLRAFVWLNLFLAALNFLPAWPLDAGGATAGLTIRRPGAAKDASNAKEASDTKVGSAAGASSYLRLNAVKSTGFLIAVGLIVGGIILRNWWMLMGGVFVLLGAQVERKGLAMPRQTDTTKVGEVMLTDYSILPASATLEDAMMQARHSLQDVFPVIRAGNMVGAVGRQSILDALRTTGNGYVQGIMTRSFQTASAEDSLMETLDKAMAESGGALQIVPVVSGEMVVGILTPQHLQRSLGLIPRVSRRVARTKEDETE
jgi:Zn-dependent protease